MESGPPQPNEEQEEKEKTEIGRKTRSNRPESGSKRGANQKIAGWPRAVRQTKISSFFWTIRTKLIDNVARRPIFFELVESCYRFNHLRRDDSSMRAMKRTNAARWGGRTCAMPHLSESMNEPTDWMIRLNRFNWFDQLIRINWLKVIDENSNSNKHWVIEPRFLKRYQAYIK